ncbi:hypothetical protein STEG23_000330 [Scotinomys teguina]
MTELLSSLGQKLLALIGLLLILVSTGLFMKRFLGPCGWKYENVYITRQFVQFDERERHQQRPCVLPLNKKERKNYVIIPSLQLTPRERKNLGLFFLPILTHLYMWVLFAAVDYLLYRLISSVNRQFQNLPRLEVHLKLHGQRQGTQDVIHDSSFNISMFEPSCIPKPQLGVSETWVPLSIILVTLIALGLLSSMLMQLKILVSGSFYPGVERERIQYLHAKLLKKRSKQPLGEAERKPSLDFKKLKRPNAAGIIFKSLDRPNLCRAVNTDQSGLVFLKKGKQAFLDSQIKIVGKAQRRGVKKWVMNEDGCTHEELGLKEVSPTIPQPVP